MEEELIDELNLEIDNLNSKKENILCDYNSLINDLNTISTERYDLEKKSKRLAKTIELIVEDRLEKLSSIWALITMIISCNFLMSFCNKEFLEAFLMTMFCSVPISKIGFYICELLFYNKFEQFFIKHCGDLKSLCNKLEGVNVSVDMLDKSFSDTEAKKSNLCSLLVDINNLLDTKNNELASLCSISPLDESLSDSLKKGSFKKLIRKP